MSMTEMIARQYDYNCWANAKILRGAERLSDEQYFAETPFRSLHDLLVHLVGVEWVWRTLAQSGALPGPPPSAEKLQSLGDVQARQKEEEAAVRAWLQEVTDADLSASVETRSPRGETFTFARWEMLQHMLLHSMQHRTEAAAILTEYDQSPGDLDFLFFVIGRE